MQHWFTFLFALVLVPLAGQNNFFHPDQIRDIRITLAASDWAEQLDSLKQRSSNERLPGSVTVDGVRYDSVGVRYKGNSSYHNVQKYGGTKLPFNVELDFVRDQALPNGTQTLKLSNVFRDPSYVREVLAYEVARDYMPAPQCNFARVYVNGEFMGLYNSSESIDERFLAEHYGGDGGGVLFKCDPSWDKKDRPGCKKGDKASLQYLGEGVNCYFPYYELKSDTGWTELKQLTEVLNKDLDRIEEYLDVPAVLWMHAFNNALVNLDSYTGMLCHNYYLYRKPNGQFVPVVWDMNLSFGAFRFLTSWNPLDDENLQKLSPFVHYKQKNPLRPLIVQLLSVPEYRKLYAGFLRTIYEDHFEQNQLAARARTLHSSIAPAVRQDERRLYPIEDFERNMKETVEVNKVDIIGIEQLLLPRRAYLSSHPVLSRELPELTRHEATTDGDVVRIRLHATDLEAAAVHYRTGSDQRFVAAPAVLAEPGIWTAEIPKHAELEYYLVGEGKRLSRVLPRNAPFGTYNSAGRLTAR